MSYPVNGTCQCGAVHYQVKKKPLKTVICHCTDCQKLSAGAFSMTMMLRRDDFELLRGNWLNLIVRQQAGISRVATSARHVVTVYTMKTLKSLN